jgi:hypothetical protein
MTLDLNQAQRWIEVLQETSDLGWPWCPIGLENHPRVEAYEGLSKIAAKLVTMARERDVIQREAERLRHGEPVDGDFVCPDSLRVSDLEAEVKTLRETLHEVLDFVVLGVLPKELFRHPEGLFNHWRVVADGRSTPEKQ